MTKRKSTSETNGTVDFNMFAEACRKHRVMIPSSNWAILPAVTADSVTLSYLDNSGMSRSTTIPRTHNETMQTGFGGGIVYATDGGSSQHQLQFLANVRIGS